MGVAYNYYVPDTSCYLNTAFISLTLVFGVCMVGVLFAPSRVASAGLLTSGAVFLYACYLLLSALNSEPADAGCVRGGGTNSRWIQARASTRL